MANKKNMDDYDEIMFLKKTFEILADYFDLNLSIYNLETLFLYN